jgi:hypothetical protein
MSFHEKADERPARRCAGLTRLAVPLAALAACPVIAEEQGSRFYAGAGIASADFEDRHVGIGYDDAPLAWHAYGGFRFRDRIAFELGYKTLGDIESGEIAGSGMERLEIGSEFDAVFGRLRASLSLSELFGWQRQFTVFGTIGYFDSETNRRVVEFGASRTSDVSIDDGGIALGAGLIYRLGKVDLRGYVERFEVGDGAETFDVGVAAEIAFGAR